MPGVRPGAQQTGLQVILAMVPELESLSPPYACGIRGLEGPRGVPGASQQGGQGSGGFLCSNLCSNPRSCHCQERSQGLLVGRGGRGEGGLAGQVKGVRCQGPRGLGQR